MLVVGLAPLNTSEKWMEPVKIKTGAIWECHLHTVLYENDSFKYRKKSLTSLRQQPSATL